MELSFEMFEFEAYTKIWQKGIFLDTNKIIWVKTAKLCMTPQVIFIPNVSAIFLISRSLLFLISVVFEKALTQQSAKDYLVHLKYENWECFLTWVVSLQHEYSFWEAT